MSSRSVCWIALKRITSTVFAKWKLEESGAEAGETSQQVTCGPQEGGDVLVRWQVRSQIPVSGRELVLR